MNEREDSSKGTTMLAPAQECFRGAYCSINANSCGDVVFTYHPGVFSSAMCYRLGRVIGGSRLTWEDEHQLDHCKGKYPKVAINDYRVIVVVYMYSSNINHTLGTWSGSGPICWGNTYTTCEGYDPSVAISNEMVMLVYCNNYQIHFKVGSTNSVQRTITWIRQGTLTINARYPSVALNGDLFVVLYQSYYSTRLLTVVGKAELNNHHYCTVTHGEVQDDSEGKADPKDFFEGDYPSISLFSDGTVVCTHQRGRMMGRNLFARCGKIISWDNTIRWHEARSGCIVRGALTSVAAVDSNRKTLVEVHGTNAMGGNGLYFSTGIIA